MVLSGEKIMTSRGEKMFGRWETDCLCVAPEGIGRNAEDRDLFSPFDFGVRNE
jgi:hypothetical protein